MAMTAWSAKVFHQIDLPVGEGFDPTPDEREDADQVPVAEKRLAQRGPIAADPLMVVQLVFGVGQDIRDVDGPPL